MNGDLVSKQTDIVKPPQAAAPPHETLTLENGESIYGFRKPGVKIDLNAVMSHEQMPIGTALVAFENGNTIAANRRAMVTLGPSSENGTFSKDPANRGVVISDRFPNGVPDFTIGELWEEYPDAGRVAAVLVRPGFAFNPSQVPEGTPTPHLDMFDSAQDVLRSFEAAQR